MLDQFPLHGEQKLYKNYSFEDKSRFVIFVTKILLSGFKMMSKGNYSA